MKLIGAAVVVATALIVLWTSYYTVAAESEGVVLRFGKFLKTVEPGLHFKLPLGIDEVSFLPTRRQLKLEFGFYTAGYSNPRSTNAGAGRRKVDGDGRLERGPRGMGGPIPDRRPERVSLRCPQSRPDAARFVRSGHARSDRRSHGRRSDHDRPAGHRDFGVDPDAGTGQALQARRAGRPGAVEKRESSAGGPGVVQRSETRRSKTARTRSTSRTATTTRRSRKRKARPTRRFAARKVTGSSG